jgi:GTP-binding protein HflX
LLHVIDANDENRDAHIAAVGQVLESINAHEVPCLLVYNKIDLSEHLQAKLDRDDIGQARRVFISAHTGEGISVLAEAIGEMLGKNMTTQEVVLLPAQGKLRAELYERGAVLSENIDAEGQYHLLVRIPQMDFEKLFR